MSIITDTTATMRRTAASTDTTMSATRSCFELLPFFSTNHNVRSYATPTIKWFALAANKLRSNSSLSRTYKASSTLTKRRQFVRNTLAYCIRSHITYTGMLKNNQQSYAVTQYNANPFIHPSTSISGSKAHMKVNTASSEKTMLKRQNLISYLSLEPLKKIQYISLSLSFMPRPKAETRANAMQELH